METKRSSDSSERKGKIRGKRTKLRIWILRYQDNIAIGY